MNPALAVVGEPDPEPEPLGPLEVPLLTVQPTKGPLRGRTLRMRWPSARYLIAMERDSTNNTLFVTEILDAIEEHDLGREPDSMPWSWVESLGFEWAKALKDLAVPPENGSD